MVGMPVSPLVRAGSAAPSAAPACTTPQVRPGTRGAVGPVSNVRPPRGA